MSTYSELQQRVADYINRSDFTSQIKQELKQAIRSLERQRWRFNETSTALVASAGQAFLALPSNYLVFDYLEISLTGGIVPFTQSDLATILEMRATSTTGIPTHFTIYADQIEIAIKPDSAYSCPLHYIKSLPELSADGDTNSWTNGLFQDAIVYHAAKQIWGLVLRDQKEASIFAALERDTISLLSMENMQFHHTGITPTRF